MAKRMVKRPRPGDPYQGPVLIVSVGILIGREDNGTHDIHTQMAVEGDEAYVERMNAATETLRPHVDALRTAICEVFGGAEVVSETDLLAARRKVGRA